MSRLVAIVGRPNVGKSTLFNRLTQTRRAIVDDTAGTTRDRQYGTVDWCGQEFSIVDTGGWVVNSEDIFEEEINKQVEIAIEEADVILFVVDASNGITDLDDHVAAILRRSKKPVILVANKEDVGDARYNVPEFYSLGLGTPFEVSSANGSGTGELLDEIIADMPEPREDDKPEDDIAKIAIVGRPNAGKSSLINAFIGEERHIVTDIAGTTRDSIYHRYNKFGFDFYLVDTAGIRKKQKVNEDIEYYSVIRSIRAIEASDVCILMIDATRGIEGQDANIFGLIQRNRKGLVVCVNKWDLVEDRSLEAQKRFETAIRNKLAPFTDFPIIFTSALTKQRIHKVLETATHVFENRKRIIPTSQLNSYMLEVVAETPPPSNKGKFVKIKYVTMLKDAVIPTFVFFCNLPQWVKEPYRRFLENKIRAKWDFHGSPIAIFMRDKS
ncbi:MAG: ribosome biogenesis GTPase Der [Bacteroidales bacterium]|nr:ribosome biogenesis GTPase Der [Bacteroidales bacterium]MBD5217800.1 ribosome biogenesis GTPase Der [Bacteroidales bacterium]